MGTASRGKRAAAFAGLTALAALGGARLEARALERAPAVVALRLVPPAEKIGDGEIFMACAFDGAPSACRLDTGAGDKILVPAGGAFARYAAIKSGSNENDSGARARIDIIRIGRLRLGGADFGPIDVKRRSRDSRPRIAPLIGPQAVARRGFALRFRGTTELVVDGPAPAGLWQPLAAYDRDRHLLMKAVVGGDRVTALFDTGAGITEIDRDYVAAHPREFASVGVMRTPGRADAEIYRMPPLTLGGRRFDGTDAVAVDFSFYKKKLRDDDLRLMLGYNVITRADWFFDLSRRRWSVSN